MPVIFYRMHCRAIADKRKKRDQSGHRNESRSHFDCRISLPENEGTKLLQQKSTKGDDCLPLYISPGHPEESCSLKPYPCTVASIIPWSQRIYIPESHLSEAQNTKKTRNLFGVKL